jgi:hypothetical protein
LREVPLWTKRALSSRLDTPVDRRRDCLVELHGSLVSSVDAFNPMLDKIDPNWTDHLTNWRD